MPRRGSASNRGYGHRWQATRAAVLERDRHTCYWCGGPATEADHLVAKVDGGPDSFDNLVASCKPCNARRGARVKADRQRADRLRPGRGWSSTAQRGDRP